MKVTITDEQDRVIRACAQKMAISEAEVMRAGAMLLAQSQGLETPEETVRWGGDRSKVE